MSRLPATARLSVESLGERVLPSSVPLAPPPSGGTTAVHVAVEVNDFGFGVENPTTIGSATGGAGAGKIKFNEFTIK